MTTAGALPRRGAVRLVIRLAITAPAVPSDRRAAHGTSGTRISCAGCRAAAQPALVSVDGRWPSVAGLVGRGLRGLFRSGLLVVRGPSAGWLPVGDRLASRVLDQVADGCVGDGEERYGDESADDAGDDDAGRHSEDDGERVQGDGVA